jgi:hypothetical protein
MAKLDKLKLEADILKSYLFFVLSAIFTSTASAIGLLFKLLENGSGKYGAVLFVVMLLLLKFSAIIFFSLRKKFKNLLIEIEKE